MPGNAAPTRTPTASCANISPSARAWPTSPNTLAIGSRRNSIAGRASDSATEPRRSAMSRDAQCCTSKLISNCSNSASVCSGSARLGLEIPIPHEKQQINQDRQPAKRIEEARKLAHESDDEAHSKPAGVPAQDRTKGGSIGVVLR